LSELKEGDQLEVTGKVFATPLDEPWVDVLKIKRLKAAVDEKEKKASADAASSK
jgi:lysyl-tRNA synthetase class II